MSNLLRKLQTESFLFTLRDPVTVIPQLPGDAAVKLVDDHTLEIEVSKEQSLNDIFARLSAAGLDVISMRNKVNRLEEMFMRLVENRTP
jgi:ABC-2 type transport system ATP-binding protein